MANKEVMVVTPEDMANLVPSAKAMDAYKFAIAHAGIEMDEGATADFITTRNLKTDGFRELNEVRKWMEKTVASIKEALKHTYNVGDYDELPETVKWSKQSYTHEWACEDAPRFVAQRLIESGLVTAEQLFDTLTVNAMCKAAGITTEKLEQMFDGAVNPKPKERTLSIK